MSEHALYPANQLQASGASAFEIAQVMGWSDIRMAMRYTHATGEGIRRAMQLLTKSKTGTNGRSNPSTEDRNDAKVPTKDGNGQQVLPVSV